MKATIPSVYLKFKNTENLYSNIPCIEKKLDSMNKTLDLIESIGLDTDKLTLLDGFTILFDICNMIEKNHNRDLRDIEVDAQEIDSTRRV